MDLKNYNLETSEQKIIEACQKIKETEHIPAVQQTCLNYLTSLLNLKYQERILLNNKNLAFATWGLVIVTSFLVIVNLLLPFFEK